MKPLSVQAADYIERGINRRYGAASKGEAQDIPAGLKGLRNRVRAIIDPSGLGDARATAAEAILVPLNQMLIASVWINLVLCIFNFLPIPPLDGSRILMGLLPDNLAMSYMRIERFGFIIILVLAFSGLLSKAIVPIISFANSLLLS